VLTHLVIVESAAIELGAVELSLTDLGLAALLVLLNAGISLALKLGLERRLLLAAVRATVQLALLGLLLGWVFEQGGPGAVLPVMLIMASLAGVEAVRRSSRRVPGIWAAGIGVMLASSLAVTLYGLLVVLDTPGAWYTPQYAIPLLGMVLGNALNGISLGLDAALEGFDEDRARVELLLAHGATRRQAAAPVLRRAVRRGMIPILNAMVAVGIISVPGMMTGQLLAGEDPQNAARYQLFILFAIAGAVALGTVGVVLATERLVFDERDRLRVDRLRRVGGND
jgi:UDP-glucose/iron transport system permease protein